MTAQLVQMKSETRCKAQKNRMQLPFYSKNIPASNAEFSIYKKLP